MSFYSISIDSSQHCALTNKCTIVDLGFASGLLEFVCFALYTYMDHVEIFVSKAILNSKMVFKKPDFFFAGRISYNVDICSSRIIMFLTIEEEFIF